MQPRSFANVGVACGVLAVGILAAQYAEAQTSCAERQDGMPAAMQPMPAEPTPNAAPITQPAAALPDSAAVTAPADPGATPGQMRQGARLIRGRQLIGMPVWGRNRERLGTIRDFVIDSAGTRPSVYLAMEPVVFGWSGGYAIVPFDALKMATDAGPMGNHFVLDVAPDKLLRAPHLASDRWDTLRGPQFFMTARQFYRQTERTDASNAGGGLNGQEVAQPNGTQGETPPLLGNESPVTNQGAQFAPGGRRRSAVPRATGE